MSLSKDEKLFTDLNIMYSKFMLELHLSKHSDRYEIEFFRPVVVNCSFYMIKNLENKLKRLSEMDKKICFVTALQIYMAHDYINDDENLLKLFFNSKTKVILASRRQGKIIQYLNGKICPLNS